MKKSLFYLFAIICSMSLFVACSDDDDDNDNGVASQIVGNYTGKMVVTTAQATLPEVNQTVNVSKSDANTVAIQVANFSIAGMDLGTITAACAVSKSGSNYALSGNTKVKVPTLGNIEVPVTVTGEVAGSQLTLNIVVPLGTDNTVTAAFTGTK